MLMWLTSSWECAKHWWCVIDNRYRVKANDLLLEIKCLMCCDRSHIGSWWCVRPPFSYVLKYYPANKSKSLSNLSQSPKENTVRDKLPEPWRDQALTNPPSFLLKMMLTLLPNLGQPPSWFQGVSPQSSGWFIWPSTYLFVCVAPPERWIPLRRVCRWRIGWLQMTQPPHHEEKMALCPSGSDSGLCVCV